MKKALFLLAVVLFVSGCSSLFMIKGADEIPEKERVKVIVDRCIIVRKIDGDWALIVVRGPGSSQTYTYVLKPGSHTFVLEYMAEEDRGTAIVISRKKGMRVKTDTRADPVELKYTFLTGKTYKINFRFPDSYSIQYLITEVGKEVVTN